ncbi:MAG: hypothetical protein ACI4M3_02675 [Acutalibacteraceae bacterium]
MKVKYTGIPLIILLLIGGGLKLCQTIFAARSTDFFLSEDMTTLCVASCIGLMLIIAIILAMCDHKKPVVNRVSKNVPAAIFGFVATVAILGNSALKVITLVTAGSDSIFGDVLSIFISLFGGIILLYENCILFTGINKMKNTQLLALCVPLWFCSRLVTLYAEYSKLAIRHTEIFDIVAVALMAIFFFHQSVYFAELPEKRSPVKLFVFGTPMVLCTLISTADMITKNVIKNSWTDSSIVQYVGDIAIALYAVCLMYGALKSHTPEQLQPEENETDTPSAEEVQEALKQEEKTPIVIQKIPETESNNESVKPSVKLQIENESATTEKTTANDAPQAEEEKPSEPNVRHAVITEKTPEPAPTVQPTEPKPENIIFTQKEIITASSNDEIDNLLKEIDD